MEKALKWLAVAATLSMFLVMIAGSLVTNTGSGMGCGNDWPLCHGRWVPEYTLSSIIEWSHRFVTGLAGMIVFAFTGLAWYRFAGNRTARAVALFGLFFLLLESGLGASAVIWPQSSGVLALHFGFSLLSYTGVFVLALHVLQQEKTAALVLAPVSAGFRAYVWAVALYTYGVVYLGAYVRHTGSSMGCPDWPLCQGRLIPQLSGQTGIHFAHRAAAALLLVLLTVLMIHAVRRYRETRRDVAVAAVLAFVLVILQILSGGMVVLFKLSIYVTLLHSAIITCLFGVIGYLCVQVLKEPGGVR